jgi:hypothetical protein
VLANRQGGPQRCIEIVEQRAPDGFADLDAVISREELEEMTRSYKRMAGFDPDALNNRPSLGSAGRDPAAFEGPSVPKFTDATPGSTSPSGRGRTIA